jgi:hypothetical protein
LAGFEVIIVGRFSSDHRGSSISVFDKDEAKRKLSIEFAGLVRQWCRSEIKTKRDYPNIYSEMLKDRASGSLEPVLEASTYLSKKEVYLHACARAICNGDPLENLQSLKCTTVPRFDNLME